MQALQSMEAQRNIPHTDKSERVAAAVTAATQAVPKFQLGHLELAAGTVVVHSRRDNFAEPPLSVRVDTNQAIALSPEQHAAAWQAQAVPGSQPAVAQAQLPTYAPDQLPAQDLRHPQHPRHGLYAQAGEALALTYAQIGLSRSPEQLEREALGLALVSAPEPPGCHRRREAGARRAGTVRAGVQPDGLPGRSDLAGASRALVPAAPCRCPPSRAWRSSRRWTWPCNWSTRSSGAGSRSARRRHSQGPTMG
jgi:hypothetical protein